jgi:hypothetical protein
MDTQKTSDDIAQLNSFLRGEISAVETYRMAIEKLDTSSLARSELETCQSSHQRRVDLLRSAILSGGGDPSDSSGHWGVLNKVIEGGAGVLGDTAAIAALEAGEDHGLADYRADADKVHGPAHELVMTKLLPLQEQTHRTLSDLKKRFARSS